MSYGLEWMPAVVLLGAFVLLLVPAFALIGLVLLALAAVAALVALAGAVLVSPYLLARALRRRLAERHIRQPSRIVRSRSRRRLASASQSISTILPSRTVNAPTENGRPSRVTTNPAAPLMSAGFMSSPSRE